jgi:WD40 repeat protein
MSTVPPTGPPADGATARRAARVFIEPGHILAGRYEIRRFLGRGAMGEVWLALDLKLRMEVALKDMSFRSGDLEMARREVRSARDVASSNVCRVFDLIEADGRELLSMEYVDGVTLRKVVEDRSPLPLTDAHPIASQLLAGLEAIHAAGLVHRDIKPENVMLTRTGRVVIMDFGLARDVRSDSSSIAGTPAYMPPEQERGDTIDPRTDLFAAGVVLAELITNARTRESRANIWDGIRRRPVAIADNPWASVLRKAVSRERSERFASARDMARALDEATRRVTKLDDKQPYPGLAAFTEDQAEFFFGREAEIEAMLRKLDRFHLLAIIGPSGAGKSSFLNAGLLPMLDDKWDSLVCRPGSSPFVNLGVALASKIEGPGLAAEMLRFHETDTGIGLMRRWRARHGNVLVVIDQFEELFTLNTPEVQERFADLIGHAVVDSDVRVLLSLRDDFLARCQEHERLAPMFAALTSLRAPTGAGLRRALVEPALRSGYQFEDERLIDDMVHQVGTQAGALPLLAFCAAAMWERRDRDAGLLRRQTYEEIGGVSGALAQHAEQTLLEIGTIRLPVVREIFRNLVTAEGTRIVRSRQDLLSVFQGNRSVAEEVLDALTTARLLTSTEGDIEIIHESLLTAWPRMLQWRAQDAEGAILRDQLRQATQLWDDRSRPPELLWTGNSYREFMVWQSRYPGLLTALEQEYVTAMRAHAERRKRTARLAGISVITAALIVATIMAVLWRNAVKASEQRLAEVHRAEAAKLLALAQLEIERFPTVALAYATKSLEIHDTPEGRQFALNALWRGPVAMVLPWKRTAGSSMEFSPDGKWLSFLGNQVDDFLIPENGNPPIRLEQPATPTAPATGFDPNSRFVIAAVDHGPEVRIFSLPDGAQRKLLNLERETYARIGGARMLTISRTTDDTAVVRSWAYDGMDSRVVGTVRRPTIGWREPQMSWSRELDPTGAWTIFTRDGEVRRLFVGDRQRREHSLWKPTDPVRFASVSNSGEWLIGLLIDGIALKSLKTGEERRLSFAGGGKTHVNTWAEFDKDEKRISWSNGFDVSVWDLRAPPDADPRTLRNTLGDTYMSASFHPTKPLLATSHGDGIAFWPTAQPEVRVFSGSYDFKPQKLRFSRDGRWLAACSVSSGLVLLPLDPHAGSRREIPELSFCTALDVHPTDGSFLAAGQSYGVAAFHVDQPIRRIARNPMAPLNLSGTTSDPTGNLVVSIVGPRDRRRNLRIWNLQKGTETVLPLPGISFNSAFDSRGTLYTSGDGGIRAWNLVDGTNRIYFGAAVVQRMKISDDRRFLLAGVQLKKTQSPEDRESEVHELRLFDLVHGTSRVIRTHGSNITALAINRNGDLIATGDMAGVIRVGSATGAEPHLLLGSRAEVEELVFSPDSMTIASADAAASARLWPVPDLGRTPLHLMPHDMLITKLRGLTNVRAIPDSTTQTGYRIAYDPFPGWKTIPTW